MEEVGVCNDCSITFISIYSKVPNMAGGSNTGYISQELARNIFSTSTAGTHTKQLGLPTFCIQSSGTSLVHEDLRNLYRNMRAMHSFKTVVKCRNQSYCCDIK